VKKIINCKHFIWYINYDITPNKAMANFVPAGAEKRKGQALFGLIGRKGYVGGKLTNNLNLKFYV
jgi:hypothetical protein